jgi:hypothetical protein
MPKAGKLLSVALSVLQGGGRGLSLAAAHAMWKMVISPQNTVEADIMLVFFSAENAGSYVFGPRPVEDFVTQAQRTAAMVESAFLNI